MRIDNADTLPYFVMHAGQRVPVQFKMLEPNDEQRITDAWAGSVYFDLWQYDASQAVMRQTTRKLIVADGNDESILGLLRMGSAVSIRLIYRKLNTQSVLETAPRLRYRGVERSYHGIGKVLVARLIAESIVQGHGGALRCLLVRRQFHFTGISVFSLIAVTGGVSLLKRQQEHACCRAFC